MRDLRKLAVCSLPFAAAVFAADYWIPLGLLPWLTVAFALLFALLALPHRRWLLGFTLASAGISLGFISFYLHAQHTLIPAQMLDGQTRFISGEVNTYPQAYDDYSRLELFVSGGELPRGKILLYGDADTLSEYEPGDRIACTAKLKRPDIRYGERYDNYISRGIYLTGTIQSDPQLIGGGASLRTLPLRLGRAVSDKIGALFPADTAPFMKSLMLGDKSDLYEDLSLHLAMSRAGFLHIVAVSGMHIAFLVGLIQLLFGKTWRSSVFCLLLIWFFVLLTGSSPSAIRAAVMQSFLLTAPLVKRENDPVTSLSAALALILIGNPYAAGSVSLQLSFSAMAGILCLTEPLHKSVTSMFPEVWALRLRVPIGILASSLSVLAFSVPFMAWHFGSLSLLSPISNVLGLWAVSFCFCGGYVSCLLGFVFAPLGTASAWLVSWAVRYLIFVARTVSSIPFAVLYLRKLPDYCWIVLVYALSLLSACSIMNVWKKLLLPLGLSALMLALLLTHNRAEYRRGGVISVIDVGQGQSIAVMSGDDTVVVDCGAINTLDSPGEETGAYLLSCGRDHIDALFLTHLHADHVNGVPMLLEMLPVERIILPANVEDEDGMLEEILSSAERHGTELQFLQDDAEYSFCGIRVQLFAPFEKGQINERCMTGVFSLGSYDMLITGDSSKSTEKELLKQHPLQDMELLIVGHHGSRYASSGELLGSIGAHTAVISVGYNNFGHPTYETLERLAAYGYTIYRTDLNGTVEIRVEN